MLSNTKCKKILNKNGIHYTDKEVTILKETLYKLAEIMWEDYRTQAKLSVLKQIL